MESTPPRKNVSAALGGRLAPVRTSTAHGGTDRAEYLGLALIDARVQLWADLWADAALARECRARLEAIRHAIETRHLTVALELVDKLEQLCARPVDTAGDKL